MRRRHPHRRAVATLLRLLQRLDARLLSVPRWGQALVLGSTVLWIVWVSLPNVPREYVDLGPLLMGRAQQASYGTDTISDMYGAKVVLNDVSDMYARAHLAQTPVEARTWTKEASAPYPPVALLLEAALFRLGTWLGIGFYGTILSLAVIFVGTSLVLFARTRWYLFPLLYINCGYISERFVHVQDDTYLIMLTFVMVGLMLARAGSHACHVAITLAITIKLSPLYYMRHLLDMPRRWAVVCLGVLVAGLVLPCVIWDNYLYIYRYANQLKGSGWSAAGAVALTIPVAVVLRYIEARRGFDLEDQIGWGLVPFALLLAVKMNVARHLLLVLLVPDKRGLRNIAAAAGLAVPALWPDVARQSWALWTAVLVLVVGLGLQLRDIGWRVIAGDVRDLGGTALWLLRPGALPPPPIPEPVIIPTAGAGV